MPLDKFLPWMADEQLNRGLLAPTGIFAFEKITIGLFFVVGQKQVE
jgi:hypothetical protein